jgi:hypothetical protein
MVFVPALRDILANHGALLLSRRGTAFRIMLVILAQWIARFACRDLNDSN